MPAQFALIFLGLGVILAGAKMFTNAVEWLGRKLSLPEGAVGSVLAAVGTALPETVIPIIAIFFHQGKEEIGVGAILGAPFMLATLGFFVIGISLLIWSPQEPLKLDYRVVRRDLAAFLLVYWVAIICSFVSYPVFRQGAALFLVLSYFFYVKRTIALGRAIRGKASPLYFSRRRVPGLGPVVFQLGFALLLIIAGAQVFVENLSAFALSFGFSPFLLSVIIAPVATELPEKFNSVFWVREKKYTLAVGNMTGAMVFQSSIIPALGILYTPWQIGEGGLLVCILALFAALFMLAQSQRGLKTGHFLACGLLYLLFLLSISF